MQQESPRPTEIVDNFIESCIDKRVSTCINLKAAQSLMREAIEKKISENRGLTEIIANNNGECLWKLIVNYTLLKMNIYSVFWEIEDSKSASSRRKSGISENQ